MRRPVLAAPVVAAGLLLAACGGGATTTTRSTAAGTTAVTVTLTDTSCTPDRTTIPAGPVTFTVVNKGSGAISEAEFKQGDKILGERENVVPGLNGSFSLNATDGSYTVSCVGADKTTPVTVQGGTAGGATTTSGSNAARNAALRAATAAYSTYVTQQVAQLVSTTKTFTDAVRAGDIAAAKAAYAAPRVNYERIEPVAETFGDLDPQIDDRIGDVASVSSWTGFHRLEYALWKQNSLAGMTPVADKLDADVAKLQGLVATDVVQPSTLANGASSLLEEIGATKITGEEENYSHLDLVDFQGNLDGSQKAYDLLLPALKAELDALPASAPAQQRAQLQQAVSVDPRFAAITAALQPYRTGTGPTDFRSYTAVPQAEHKVLSQLVDAAAEPLGEVGGLVVSS